MMWTVSSGGSSGKALERRVAGPSFFFSSKLSSKMGTSSSSVIATETCQRVSLFASTSLKSMVFLALMRSLSSPTVVVVEVEIGKALDVASPSTRQNRMRGLSAIVLRGSMREEEKKREKYYEA